MYLRTGISIKLSKQTINPDVETKEAAFPRGKAPSHSVKTGWTTPPLFDTKKNKDTLNTP
jgi:hypothetical protein